MRKFLIAVFVFALVAGACGDDGATPATSTTTSVAPPTTSSTSTTTTTIPPTTPTTEASTTTTTTTVPASTSCVSTRNRVYQPIELENGELQLGVLPVEQVVNLPNDVRITFVYVVGEFVDCRTEAFEFEGEETEVFVLAFRFGEGVLADFAYWAPSGMVSTWELKQRYLPFDGNEYTGNDEKLDVERITTAELLDRLFVGEKYVFELKPSVIEGPSYVCEGDAEFCEMQAEGLALAVELDAQLVEAARGNGEVSDYLFNRLIFTRPPVFIYEIPEPKPGITVFVEPDCSRCDEIVDAFTARYPEIPVDVVETTPDIVGEYNVNVVPTVVIFNSDGELAPGKFDDRGELSLPINIADIARRACDALGGVFDEHCEF